VAEENLQYIDYRNFPVNLTYEGEQNIDAVYLMGDWATLDWLRFIGGARYERTDLSINARNLTRNQDLPPGEIQQDDILPSLTAVFQVRSDFDIRAAWSQTVVRPTYREIADVPIYDVTQNRTYTGNPELEMSLSQNVDLRASYYPRAGEILSASLFAKRIEAPIEQASITRNNSRITYENFEKADVWGIEAEARGRLDRLWGPLEDFTLGINGAYIVSEVPLTEEQQINRASYGDLSTTRPLYNQPTFVLNADLTWDHVASGTTVTLSGGVVGESLILVGLASPDEFVQPAPQLNLFVQQRLGTRWDIRFTAKNLLDPRYEVAQTWPIAGERVLQSHTRGITLGLSVGYSF
jgi:TonB-dependent receptor